MSAPSTSTTPRARGASSAAHQRASAVIPFGMASQARGHADVVAARSYGPYIEDIDGNRYVDCVLSLGPMFHGNNPPSVIEAVTASLQAGIRHSAPHEAEAQLAERLLQKLPWADKVLFTNTGTEAVQQALRLARGTTGRRMVLKFEGHYHGWIDPVYANSPGAAVTDSAGWRRTLASASSGLPAPHDDDVVVVEWGDLGAYQAAMGELGDQIAAVIVEPAVTSLGNYLPADGLLEELKATAHEHGALIIIDEVITGFRFAAGGLCEMLGFEPDLAVYAKAISSGMPLALVAGTDAAFAGALSGRVSIGGTYNATPSCLAAAQAVLDLIDEDPDMFKRTEGLAERLADGLQSICAELAVPATINQVSSLVQIFFGDDHLANRYRDLLEADSALMSRVARGMLDHGAYVLPRGLFFLSTAHTESDIDTVIAAFRASLTAQIDDG